jgi:indolepyruvate ferredoxin oxidoreductase, alpha subunit
MQSGADKGKGRRIDPLLIDEEGHVANLIGNEAIVRGALEAGVAFASGYPGTPSSEVTDSFARIAEAAGIVFEYSVNEKIAVEVAFGASLAGARSICAMKHLGLMYAGDPISTMPYIGAVGGMAIVSAGDPSCRTSPNEQDQRHLGAMLHMPVLDPCTPQMAHAMGKYVFELSEQSELPVILRPTTRVCHTRAPVRFGALQAPVVRGFKRDPQRLIPVPINARRLRLAIVERLARAQAMLEASPFVLEQGDGRAGIIAGGAPAATCADLLRELDLVDGVRLLSLGAIHPLPAGPIVEFLGKVDKVLVVEELSPYLEDAILALCARRGLVVELLGKHTGHLPLPYEYEPEIIQDGIHDALGLGRKADPARRAPELPPRPPILCPGCSHRSTYFAAKMAFSDEQLYFNDIGCYTLGCGPPLNAGDALLCMGAGFTLAAGVSRVTGQRTVGFVGDSTFFHSGMPALLDAVKERVNMVAVILDNQVTAMTGFQESPFMEVEGGVATRSIDIEAVARGIGARQVEVIDCNDLPSAIAAFTRAREAEGVSVVISQRACNTFAAKVRGAPEELPKYEIDHALCQTCGRETSCDARCDVAITTGYETYLSRSRALEDGRSEPLPEVAPCSTQCPLFLCVQGYVGHVAAGEYDKALEHIVARCTLPESVCRVCHRPCEEACLRGALDEPVAINDIKRFVVDWAARQAEGAGAYAPACEASSGKRVAIVGAGPSGLAAAHELALRGHAVTLYDRDKAPGGLLRSGIPEFRLPRAALQRDVDRILGLEGVNFVGETTVGRDVTLEQLLRRDGFDAVYLCHGAHQGSRMELEGEDAGGQPAVVDALDYLKQPEAETGARVVVVGGGNAAIDAARCALRRGAREVTIAYRRRREEMPAIPEEVEAAEAEGVALRTQLQPLSIWRGAKPGLECIATRPGDADASGRSRPEPVGGSEVVLAADQIIAAIGQVPLLADESSGALGLKRRANGTIKVDPQTGQSDNPRVFAGGDAVRGERTVTWAMACGQRAAWGIDRELRGAEAADRRLPPPIPAEAPPAAPTSLPFERSGNAPRQHPEQLAADARTEGFSEVVAPLTELQARAEAARCLACGQCGNCRSCIDLFGCPAFYIDGAGQVQIDAGVCTGCGVCAGFCPNEAIKPIATDAAEEPT